MVDMKPVTLALVLLAVPACLFAAPTKVKVKSPGAWLKVDAHYLDYGRTSLQKAATQGQLKLINQELKEMVEFRKEEGAAEGVGADHWSYWTDIRADKTKPNLIALTCYSSNYSGGAHPAHNMVGQVWTLWQGKPVQARLKTMFEASMLKNVEKLVREGYNGVRKKEFKGDGIRTEPISFTDLDNFTVSGKGVSFLFPHYVLASYAEGSFEVFVPWSKLTSFLTPLGEVVHKGSF